MLASHIHRCTRYASILRSTKSLVYQTRLYSDDSNNSGKPKTNRFAQQFGIPSRNNNQNSNYNRHGQDGGNYRPRREPSQGYSGNNAPSQSNYSSPNRNTSYDRSPPNRDQAPQYRNQQQSYRPRNEGYSQNGGSYQQSGSRPPQNQYGSRPPQNQYGQRPPQSQYGQRPPQQQNVDRHAQSPRPPQNQPSQNQSASPSKPPPAHYPRNFFMTSRNPKRRTKTNKIRKPLVKIHLPPFVSVSNLATIMQAPIKDVFKKLEGLGFEDIRHDYLLDRDNAALIADEYNIEVLVSEKDDQHEDLFPAPVNEKLLKERPPVVTIMGHVDHGKTTILDYLRKANVVAQEFGGITQHIGAFSVITPMSKKKITFLDTPGHAAFLKMRERGAIITDIVILVVAAEDSVMPQTVEAIKHAKKSGVAMIVAINKCDKHGVDIDKVLADLSRHEVDIEDYGGETQTVRISAKTGMNMDKLEEAVITLSELCEFKAEHTGIPADGWIIESQVVKGLGNSTTVLVRRGSLKPGDVIVAGQTYCKIRGMRDENGKPVKIAGPSAPVQIWGWKDLPDSGDQVIQAKSEAIAKKCVDYRITKAKEIEAARDIEVINEKRLDNLKESERLEKIAKLKKAGLDASEYEKEEEDSVKQCRYIIKADVFGSAEAIEESISGLGNEEVKSVVVSHEAGAPTDGDIELAKTTGASILCFNIKVPKPIMQKAEAAKVSISEHNVIYRLIEQVTEELNAQLKPRIEVKTLAEIEVRQVFEIKAKGSKVKVAGCKVNTGSLQRSAKVMVFRNDKEVYKGTLSTLKQNKDTVSEVKLGQECGLSFEGWEEFEEGDVIKVYEEIEHKRYL
ncbi:IFM1 [[Candida] subhashii]|uniref:Translation initiation factor IF-2, mitochondrial n=1 Tax=[Candida] subhashii TaxID=561895 RepID=A0A8J5UQN2_9ASCO|nr:IFM1 [[Candida] subhashii]KAG7664906.1 IFM1 [[Candida] subhashii]